MERTAWRIWDSICENWVPPPCQVGANSTALATPMDAQIGLHAVLWWWNWQRGEHSGTLKIRGSGPAEAKVPKRYLICIWDENSPLQALQLLALKGGKRCPKWVPRNITMWSHVEMTIGRHAGEADAMWLVKCGFEIGYNSPLNSITSDVIPLTMLLRSWQLNQLWELLLQAKTKQCGCLVQFLEEEITHHVMPRNPLPAFHMIYGKVSQMMMMKR